MYRSLSAAAVAVGVLLSSASAHAAPPPPAAGTGTETGTGTGKLSVSQYDADGRVVAESAIAAQNSPDCVAVPIADGAVREVFVNDSGASADIYTNGTCAGFPLVRAPHGSTSKIRTSPRPAALGVIFHS